MARAEGDGDCGRRCLVHADTGFSSSSFREYVVICIYSFKASHPVGAARLRAQRTGMCPIAWTTCARSMSSPRVVAAVLLARCTVEGGYHLLCALFLMLKTRNNATHHDAVSARWSRVTRPETLAVGSSTARRVLSAPAPMRSCSPTDAREVPFAGKSPMQIMGHAVLGGHAARGVSVQRDTQMRRHTHV